MGRLEQKEIRYSGYSTLPDDYQCKDGAIAFATNATYEDGGLKRIPEALPIALLVAQGAEVYIHHTVNYYHYIIIYKFTDEEGNEYARLYVVDKKVMEDYLSTANEESGAIPTFVDAMYHCTGSTFDEDTDPEHNKPLNMSAGVVDFLYRCDGAFVSLVAVGNTLIVSTDVAMYYFLCKAGGLTEDDEQTPLTEYCTHPYIFLGNKVPSVDVAFALDLECEEYIVGATGVLKRGDNSEDYDSDDDEGILQSALHSCTILTGTTFQGDYNYNDGNGCWRFDSDFVLEKDKDYAVIFYSDVNDDCGVNGYYLHGANMQGAYEEVEYFSSRGEMESGFTFHPFIPKRDYTSVGIRITDSNGSPSGTVFIASMAWHHLNGARFLYPCQTNYDAILAAINKFVEERGNLRNRFIYPFFVRYAVRMYDSSVCELSVPIYMCPNSGYTPLVWASKFRENRSSSHDVFHDNLYLFAYTGMLKYMIGENIDPAWKDIILGIDVYVSPPIYPYQPDEEFSYKEKLFVYKDYSTDSDLGISVDEITDCSYGVGRLVRTEGTEVAALDTKGYIYRSLPSDAYTLYRFCDPEARLRDPYRITLIAPKSDQQIDDEIARESRFYLIKKINLEEISKTTEFVDIGMEAETLSGLDGREALSEDVLGYDSFIGCKNYSYNQRLHIFDGLLKYRAAISLPCQCQRADNQPVMTTGYHVYWWFYEAWVYIRTDEGTKVVHTRYDKGAYFSGSVWFFYPNNRAVKVVIGYATIEGGEEQYLSLPLHEHDFLNGAYFFLRTKDGLMDDAFEEYKIDERPADGEDSITSTSIYVSEVDNPFVFRNSTVVTAGSGKVLALSTAAQAMSQGQFGQYPLYAFTDEGIWSLSVNSDGTYGTSQPLSRDVVTNVNSITQLDSSVLFVTDRGIMKVYGSTVTCISDSIDGEWGEFNPLSLPYFLDLYMQYIEGVLPSDEGYADKVAAVEAMFAAWAERRFFEFIQTCRMVYDYTHQRIIVYNDDSRIAYVLSLKSKEWGLLFTDLRRTVNSYPEALALRKVADGEYEGVSGADGEDHWCLENLSTYRSVAEGVSVDDDVSTELFVSRPFKLDAPDIYKTVESVVQRGYFQQSMQENHIVGVVLYGSPDLFNWFIVAQSSTDEVAGGLLSAGHIIDKVQGDPYKYFRVVVVTRMSAKESVCGCSVLYELKDNNILR